MPPPFAVAVARIEGQGWAAVLYTSHNHTPVVPRYRIVLLLTEEIATDLPAVEVIANLLGLLGVLDTSKIGASSLFYLPSAAPGAVEHHETVVVDGAPIDAAWMRESAGALLAVREAEQARQRAEALEAATRRREERIRQGFDPNSSIIESIRDRLDLAGELIGHGYKPVGASTCIPHQRPALLASTSCPAGMGLSGFTATTLPIRWRPATCRAGAVPRPSTRWTC